MWNPSGPGVEPLSPVLAGRFLTTGLPWNFLSTYLSLGLPSSTLLFSWWFFFLTSGSVQFSSVAQLCPTVCNPIIRSTPGLTVHHQLPESTQTHVHRGSDAIQPSHPLWCHPTISSSVISFSSYPQPFPASGSFQMRQFFPSGGQSIEVSASTSVRCS